jgi:flagellar biosynthesis/type III secretory pathway protein FliH
MALVLRLPEVEAEPVPLTYDEPALVPPAPSVEEPPASIAYKAPARAPEPDPAELEALRERAREEGYAAGREAGEKAARAELEEHIGALRELVQSLRQALAEDIAGAEDLAVEIAFSAVCKVLGEATASAEGVRALVREAMAQARTAEPLLLRVSPADHALLFAEPECLRSLAADPKVEIVADESISAGGCVIQTAGGTLDARLDVQLRQLMDTLIRAREARAD